MTLVVTSWRRSRHRCLCVVIVDQERLVVIVVRAAGDVTSWRRSRRRRLCVVIVDQERLVVIVRVDGQLALIDV